jgi:cytochrome P450
MGADILPDDLSTREVISDPYPAYRQLRDRSPLNCQDLPAGSVPGIEHPLRSWALMKYVDVYRALRDHGTFSSSNNPLAGKAFPPLVLLLDDPPRHTRFRPLEHLGEKWREAADEAVDLRPNVAMSLREDP